ncbi:MAG TPA: hypothetical protein VEU73_03035 [Gemmatimonadales bacterium]|nr:hypothetical protein [Gemmatimonadales bacterium]
MQRFRWVVSCILATGLLGCHRDPTGLAGAASLTLTNQTANATLTLDIGSNPTATIPAGTSACKRFASTSDTTVFTITINAPGAAPVSEDFSWVTATDPHWTIIAADLSGTVALAEGPGGSC